jgi:hypothetical protein
MVAAAGDRPGAARVPAVPRGVFSFLFVGQLYTFVRLVMEAQICQLMKKHNKDRVFMNVYCSKRLFGAHSAK